MQLFYKLSLPFQFHASFLLLVLDPLQQMPLYSPVYCMKIFKHTRLIFQLLVETTCYFQPPVVFWSYKMPDNLKSTIFEAVNCRIQTDVWYLKLLNRDKSPNGVFTDTFTSIQLKKYNNVVPELNQ